MFGLAVVRAMELMSAYRFAMEDDEPIICVKCGREGCECDPDTCDCKPMENRKDLVKDFEE